MAQAFLWSNVGSEGPITREESAPWTGRQVAADDRLTAVKGNMFTGPDKYHALFKTFKGDQPGSTSGFRTEVYIYNNGGTTPMNQTFYHGWGGVIRSAPTDVGMNIHQQFGASGKTPALHIFVDGGSLIARVNGNGGTNSDVIASYASVKDKKIRLAYGMRPSNGSDGFVRIWLSIEGGAWNEVYNYSGPVAWGINPYPKIAIYGGSAGNTGFPWTVENHGYFDKYNSLTDVQNAMKLFVGGEEPPPPDDCSAVQAQLDAAREEIQGLQGDIAQLASEVAAAEAVNQSLQQDLADIESDVDEALEDLRKIEGSASSPKGNAAARLRGIKGAAGRARNRLA